MIVSQSGDEDAGAGGGGAVVGVAEVDEELSGIEQSGTVLGDPDSEVAVVEFGDLQCPACMVYSETTIPEVIGELVEPGEASLEFRNYLIIGPDSELAARAALAAAEQDRYWHFIEIFYRNQGEENGGYVTDEFLERIAVAAGVEDLERWNEDRQDPAITERLTESQEEAARLGLDSTPSVVVFGPGGEEFVGSADVGGIREAIGRVSG